MAEENKEVDPVTKPKGSISTGWAIAIIVIVAILVGGGIWYWYYTTTPEEITGVITIKKTSPSTSASTVDETANWETYTNNTIGFSFKYPEDFQITGNKKNLFSNEDWGLRMITDNFKEITTNKPLIGHFNIESGAELIVQVINRAKSESKTVRSLDELKEFYNQAGSSTGSEGCFCLGEGHCATVKAGEEISVDSVKALYHVLCEYRPDVYNDAHFFDPDNVYEYQFSLKYNVDENNKYEGLLKKILSTFKFL